MFRRLPSRHRHAPLPRPQNGPQSTPCLMTAHRAPLSHPRRRRRAGNAARGALAPKNGVNAPRSRRRACSSRPTPPYYASGAPARAMLPLLCAQGVREGRNCCRDTGGDAALTQTPTATRVVARTSKKLLLLAPAPRLAADRRLSGDALPPSPPPTAAGERHASCTLERCASNRRCVGAEAIASAFFARPLIFSKARARAFCGAIQAPRTRYDRATTSRRCQ